MARSIESFDMFSWRAEMIAARRRAFIAGSGWPILAATVISRASFENSFDFCASCRPLRCMMFLNWECPAMRVSSREFRDAKLSEGVRRYRPQNHRDQRCGLELFGGGLGVDRTGRRAALGHFLACCHSQLLAPFGALDPAILDKTKKPEKHEIRARSTNRKHVNGN